MKIQSCALTFAMLLGVGLCAAPMPQDQSSSQQKHGGWARHGMDPDKQLQQMGKRLNLTDAQKSQIKPILVEQQQQVQDTMQDSSLQAQDKRARMRAIREDGTNKINAILTDEQKAKLEQMREQRQAKHQHAQNG